MQPFRFFPFPSSADLAFVCFSFVVVFLFFFSPFFCYKVSGYATDTVIATSVPPLPGASFPLLCSYPLPPLCASFPPRLSAFSPFLSCSLSLLSPASSCPSRSSSFHPIRGETVLSSLTTSLLSSLFENMSLTSFAFFGFVGFASASPSSSMTLLIFR